MMREGVLLESAKRSIKQVCTPVLGLNAPKALFLFLDVTATSGTGGLQLLVECQDPVSGKWFQINDTPTAVKSVSKGLYIVCWGIGTTPAGSIVQLTQAILTNNWRVTVAVGDASNHTYSLGYAVEE